MDFNLPVDSDGYDILSYVEVACIELGIDYQNIIAKHIYQPSHKLSDTEMNELYNLSDIGINTCGGEGFGLCNLEHGMLGKPQIVSSVGGLKDIFGPEYSILIEPITKIYISNRIDFHGGYLEICKKEDFANAMNTYYISPKLQYTHGTTCRTLFLNKYCWKNILPTINLNI